MLLDVIHLTRWFLLKGCANTYTGCAIRTIKHRFGLSIKIPGPISILSYDKFFLEIVYSRVTSNISKHKLVFFFGKDNWFCRSAEKKQHQTFLIFAIMLILTSRKMIFSISASNATYREKSNLLSPFWHGRLSIYDTFNSLCSNVGLWEKWKWKLFLLIARPLGFAKGELNCPPKTQKKMICGNGQCYVILQNAKCTNCFYLQD